MKVAYQLAQALRIPHDLIQFYSYFDGYEFLFVAYRIGYSHHFQVLINMQYTWYVKIKY